MLGIIPNGDCLYSTCATGHHVQRHMRTARQPDGYEVRKKTLRREEAEAREWKAKVPTSWGW